MPMPRIQLDARRFMQAQARAVFNVLNRRDGIETPEAETEARPVHREEVRTGMSTPDRRANYLHQPGGKRIHFKGSEGGLTGPQQRRLKHKMGHRKQLAIKHRRAR